MGEWTIHIDTPEGTSLEGSTEIAKGLVKELGGIEGVAQLEPTITERPTHIHLLGFATPYEERKVSEDYIVTELRKRLAAHPSYKPSITIRNPLGGGEAGGFPISANILGPDLNQLADYSMRALALAQKMPELQDVKLSLNISNPRFTSPSTASAPRISASACRRSATRCVWPSPATTRSRTSARAPSSIR